MIMKRIVPGLFCMLALAGCSSFKGDDEPLEGERISVLELQQSLEPDAQSGAVPAMPPAWRNEFWPQAGGYPNHSMQNLELNAGALKEVWSADIGDGSRDGLPLTAQPVVVDGKVFTLDTDSTVRAFIRPTSDAADPAGWSTIVPPVISRPTPPLARAA